MAEKKSEIVLTRYLFNKSTVAACLEDAIAAKKYEEACYWAYEIYYSGFQEEVLEYLMGIIETKYKHHIKLNAYLKKKYEKEPECATLPATIIKNMLMKNAENPEGESPRFVAIKEYQIEMFKTKDTPTPGRNFEFLRTVCKTPTKLTKMGKRDVDSLLDVFRNKWIYYASRSPIWASRIKAHNGKIDGRKKTVTFNTDDDLEEFHDTYNYEPDEQPIIFQKQCMGIL